MGRGDGWAIALGLVAGTLVSGATAQTQETTEPVRVARAAPITVTALRTRRPVDEVPATVSVIDSEEIEENLATGIKDLVRYEPGVSVRRSPTRFTAALSSTGRDGDSGFNIRGLEGNRVLIQVDGIRVPDGFGFGPQAVGRGDYVDLDLLKSVEILRGPASALYGSDGLAGAVSFITKDPEDVLDGKPGIAARLRGSYASADESFSENAYLAGGGERLQGLVAYTRRDGHELDNQGTNDSPNTNRTTPNPQDSSSDAVMGKLVYKLGEEHRLRLTYEKFDAETDTHVLSANAVPPLAATSVIDLVAKDTMGRERIGIDHRWDGEGGFIDHVFAAFYHQSGQTRQFTAEDRNTAADRTRDNTFDNRVTGLALELGSSGQTGVLAHRFIYGADVSRTRQEGIRSGTVPTFPDVFPTRAFPNTDYILAGAFAQDEITFGKSGFKLYPALRFDHYELEPKPDALYPLPTAGQSDGHVSPKLGVVWQIAKSVQVFANFARGFKAPSPSQVNSNFSNVVVNYTSIPNPGLKPETSSTIEGGVRLSGEAWSASATAFSGEYKDFIEQVQVSGAFLPLDPAVFQYINLSGVKISGAEARVQAFLEHGLSLFAAASYARGTVESGGTKFPLDSIDPWKFVSGLAYRNPRGFGGQLFLTHASEKSASRVNGTCGTALGSQCFRPAAFSILDATAYWDITRDLTLRAALFNITDESYWWWGDVRGLSTLSATRDAYTQPGRNFSLSLALKI